MTLSFVFMVCNLYSQLWLSLTLDPNQYLILDNSKQLIASVSWFDETFFHVMTINQVSKCIMRSPVCYTRQLFKACGSRHEIEIRKEN